MAGDSLTSVLTLSPFLQSKNIDILYVINYQCVTGIRGSYYVLKSAG